ncbi:MAG: DUF3352 domain-containing protein [Pyrinomonadaceae bacterium]
MNFPASPRRTVATLLLLLALLTPCLAQRPSAGPRTPKPAPVVPAAKPQPAAPAVTFDTLLAADSYAIYGEVRGIGQYLNSKEVTELTAPLGLPGGAPTELLDLMAFMRAHEDALLTARLLFAALPARPKLPEGFAAIELSSPEQAQKFETDLRKFLTTHLPPPTSEPSNTTTTTMTTTTPTVETARGPVLVATAQPDAQRSAARRANRAKEKAAAPSPPPFHLARAGTLLVLSDTPFTLADLRPADAPLLADEPGFQAARARFAHEMLFLYVNTKRIDRNSNERRAKYEREAEKQRAEEERARKPGDGAKTEVTIAAPATSNTDSEPSKHNPDEMANLELTPGEKAATPEEQAALEIAKSEPPPPAEEEKKLTPEEAAQAEKQRAAEQLLSALPSVLFGGVTNSNNWPESIAAAVELTDNELVVRALFVGEGGDRPARPIPFVPVLVSGPALTPEAASVVPADTDVLVSASLDLPQMYDYVASALGILDVATRTGEDAKRESFSAQLAGFEKTNGFRIKEDLLAALSNEIAIAAPAQWLGLRRGPAVKAGANGNGPIFIIALNDKRALQNLLPRALDSVGLKGVSTQQLLEKRGDVELLTLSQGSVAFIDRFLVIAPDAATMRHIADAYNNRETLANSAEFRNAQGWQPRQVLGQIYVSSGLLKNAFEDPKVALEEIEDPTVRDVLLKLNAEPGAITHALTKDDQGLLHELHIPKDVLSLMSADAIISQQLAPLRSHEGQAHYALQGLAEAEAAYKQKHGKYATLEDFKQLADEAEKRAEANNNDDNDDNDEGEGGFVPQAEGYEFKLSISGDKFEATATPTIYRKTGRHSFYIDQTGVLRAADLNGKPADASAPPVD